MIAYLVPLSVVLGISVVVLFVFVVRRIISKDFENLLLMKFCI